MRCFGRQAAIAYGPQMAGNSVVNRPPFAAAAFLHTKLAVAWKMVVNQIGANGSFSTIVPLWESAISTWSSDAHFAAQDAWFLGSAMRSIEYFTSSAVSSPNPPLHWMPLRR